MIDEKTADLAAKCQAAVFIMHEPIRRQLSHNRNAPVSAAKLSPSGPSAVMDERQRLSSQTVPAASAAHLALEKANCRL